MLASLYAEEKFTAVDNDTILGDQRFSVAGPSVVPAVAGGSIVLEVPG